MYEVICKSICMRLYICMKLLEPLFANTELQEPAKRITIEKIRRRDTITQSIRSLRACSEHASTCAQGRYSTPTAQGYPPKVERCCCGHAQYDRVEPNDGTAHPHESHTSPSKNTNTRYQPSHHTEEDPPKTGGHENGPSGHTPKPQRCHQQPYR